MGKTKKLAVNAGELISVIIAFLNEERFLAEAIESVLAQDYPNWEMILVDDGSTDGSSGLAKDFSNRHPQNIYYVDHENHANLGLSASRNFGVSRSKGSLIAILDADDVWLPGKLNHQIQLMVNNPKAAMICESSLYWSSWKDNRDDEDYVMKVGKHRDRLFAPVTLCYELYPLADGPAPCPSGLLIRRDVLTRYGGFEASFNGIYQLYEDQALLHKIYLGEYVYVSSACNNKYRQRTGSLVQKITSEGGYDEARQYFLYWLKNYLTENRIKNVKLSRLIDNAIDYYSVNRFRRLKAAIRTISTRIINLRPGNNRQTEEGLKDGDKKKLIV
jgi:glycosyltransferase involved in cell wall biosynthesis